MLEGINPAKFPSAAYDTHLDTLFFLYKLDIQFYLSSYSLPGSLLVVLLVVQ